MIKRTLLIITALVAFTSPVYATHDVQLSGDCGLTCEVTGGHNYIADDTFKAMQSRTRDGTQFGVTIVNAGGGSWSGGEFDSQWKLSDPWRIVKNVDGSALRVQGGPFTVKNVRIHMSEDAVRFQFGGNKLAEVRNSWISDTRDEIEADGRPSHVLITESYLESVHGIVSVRRGSKNRDGNPPPVLIEITDTLITMTNDQYDPRDKRKKPWSRDCDPNDPNDDYGYAHIIKTESVNGQLKGARDTVLFKNVTVVAECLAKQSLSNVRFFDPGTIIHPDSANINYVWLGPQTSTGNGGVDMVMVDGVNIPAPLGIHEYPDALFNVTDDPNVFLTAEAKFFAEYWRTKVIVPCPDRDNDGVCDDNDLCPDDKDNLCASCQIQLDEALSELENLETEMIELQATADAAIDLADRRRIAIDIATPPLQNAP